MPIFAPTLPPRPDLTHGDHPAVVLMRFDLRRVLRQRLGRFFGFALGGILLLKVGMLYVNHLMNSNATLSQLKPMASQFLPQGAEYQADHLGTWLSSILWFLVATIAGGLVARDTLYRVRPLIYAHPVRPMDYLLAKGGFSALLPFAIQLPFVLLPWILSLLIAGRGGPIWPTMPLQLLPAALVNSAIYGSVALGASAMASTPRAGVGGVLGIVLVTSAVGGLLSGLLNNAAYMALSPGALVNAWPRLCFGLPEPPFGWGPALAGTAVHVGLWTFVAWRRTRPSEAVL